MQLFVKNPANLLTFIADYVQKRIRFAVCLAKNLASGYRLGALEPFGNLALAGYRGGYRLVEALATGKLIQLPDCERFTRSDYALDGINKVDVARTENKNLQNDRSF